MRHARPDEPAGPAPYRRAQLVMAAVLALVCLIGIGMLFRGGNARDWIVKHYTLVSHDRTTGTYTLDSADNVTETTKQIRSAWKPAQQIVEPSGVFLRYHDLIVAIQPREGGGSRLTVDDEARGYTHWYTHVGGSWGVGSPVDGARGGGPGSGK